jgi:hypothetical protein
MKLKLGKNILIEYKNWDTESLDKLINKQIPILCYHPSVIFVSFLDLDYDSDIEENNYSVYDHEYLGTVFLEELECAYEIIEIKKPRFIKKKSKKKVKKGAKK